MKRQFKIRFEGENYEIGYYQPNSGRDTRIEFVMLACGTGKENGLHNLRTLRAAEDREEFNGL